MNPLAPRAPLIASMRARQYLGLPCATGLVYVVLFVTAFGLYTALWPTAPVREPDSGSYLRAAQDLQDFRLDRLQERPPGYPLLLLLTGSSVTPTRALFWASLLLHFTTVWLLGAVLWSLGLPQRLLVTFGTALLLPPYIEPAGYALSENLATLALVTCFSAMVFWLSTNKSAWILVASVGMATAALTRPSYEVLPATVVVYLLVARFFGRTPREWSSVRRGIVVIVVVSVLMIGGYASYNRIRFGHFVLTPKLGLTLSTKTFGFVERLPDEYAVVRSILINARNREVLRAGTGAAAMSIWTAIPELTEATGLEGAELDDYMLTVNRVLIVRAPLRFLEQVVWAFGCYWFPSAGDLANLGSRRIQGVWALTHFLVIGSCAAVFVLIAGAGVAAYLNVVNRRLPVNRRVRLEALDPLEVQAVIYGLAAVIVLYTAAVSSIVEVGAPRYRTPTDALMLLMVVLGVVIWRGLIRLWPASAGRSDSRTHEGRSMALL